MCPLPERAAPTAKCKSSDRHAVAQEVRYFANARVIGLALRISLVVGTMLNLINQGERVWAGGALSWPHIMLNFAVPFCVAVFSGGRSAWLQHKRTAYREANLCEHS